MGEVLSIQEKNERLATESFDELTLRLGHIYAVADVLAACDTEQCDASGVGYAICQMVEDIKDQAHKFNSLVTAEG